jgi:peptide-methionine (S)-S-oxide reductase
VSTDAFVVLAGATLVIGVLTMLGMSRGTTAAEAHDVKPLPKPAVELPAAKAGDIRSVVLAGGCFWCTEGAFAQFKGVQEVTSGYAGDTKDKADYRTVCTGTTKHAEAIKITYDAGVISYSQLLQIFFLAHDPTTKDRQGNDVGPQYRSAIFYTNDDERKVAEAYIKQLNDAKTFDSRIVTTIEPLTEFFPAEGYHQDYVANNPNQGYVRACAIPKMDKVREAYGDWLKSREKN